MNLPEPVPEELLRHERFLRGLAFGLLGDEQASEDVVQTTWLAALRRPPSELREPRAWLTTVARRLALSASRARSRSAARERAAARPEALPAASDAVEREEALRSVTDAVLGLDEPYRSTILSRWYEGLEARAIAARDGVPLATVRSRLTRAHELLRLRLDRRHGGREAWARGLAALVGGGQGGPTPLGAGAAAPGIGSSTATAAALVMTSKLKLVLALLVLAVGLLALGLRTGVLGAREPARLSPSAALAPDLSAPPGRSAEPAPAPDGRAPETTRSASAPSTTGSLALEVVWSDGLPAAGVSVALVPYGEGGPEEWSPRLLLMSRGRTDERGLLRVPRLAAGEVGLYADRGGSTLVTVAPDAETRARIAIPLGLDVVGEVVDLDGAPAVAAEVWLSRPGNPTAGVVAATTDARGRFFLRSVSTQNWVGARLAGHAPAPSRWVQGSPGDVFETRLVLQGRGASLALRVVDPAGRPLPETRVRLAELAWTRAGFPDGMALDAPVGIELVTDELGRCAAGGLMPGDVAVSANLSAHAPWQGTLTLAPGEARELEVRLERGLVLAGVVRSAAGEPLAGATVRVGRYGELSAREGQSRSDGRYRIEGVADEPAGITAVATLRDAGRAAATLHGRAGEELLWDPVIDAGRVLRGRVVDEQGTGHGGWQVNVRDSGDPRAPAEFHAQTLTDAEGRFAVPNAPETPLRVTLIESPASVLVPEAVFEALLAGPVEHELRVPSAMRASAEVRGRLLDAEGAPLAAALLLRRSSDGHGVTRWSDHATGAFRFAPLPPGTYALESGSRDGLEAAQRVLVEELLVVAGTRLDVGDLQPAPPGRLLLRLAASPDIDPTRVQMLLQRADPGKAFQQVLSGGHLPEELELPIGSYELRLFGECLKETIPFTIRAASATRLEVAPRAGARVTFLFDVPEDHGDPGATRAVFRTPDGATAWEQELHLRGELVPAADGTERRLVAAVVRVPFAPSYEVEFTSARGLSGRASVHLSAPEALAVDPTLDGRPVQVELR